MSDNTVQPPKAFISYSWTNAEHMEEVMNLAKRLSQESGVDVILDKWDLQHGHDRIAFMEQMVKENSVKKVLIVSDVTYAQKADAKKGGVGTESQIISPKLYGEVEQTKFIPIAWERNEAGEFALPTFVSHLYPIDFTTTQRRYDNYEQLVRAIYDKPLHVRPPLGSPPSFITQEGTNLATPSARFELFKNAVLQDKGTALAFARDYLAEFFSGMERFRIAPEKEGHFDDQVVKSIEDFAPWRDQLLEFTGLLIGLNKPIESTKLIATFLERILIYKQPTEDMQSYNEAWFDNYDFVIHEMFLNICGVFLVNEKFKELSYILGYHYLQPRGVRGYSKEPLGDFGEFYSYPQTLETRNKRLDLRRISLVADMLVNRAKGKFIDKPTMLAVDVLCYLYGVIHNVRWYPVTCVFLENRPNLEFFVRCRTEEGLSNVCSILDVETKSDLEAKLQATETNNQNDKWYRINNNYGFPVNLQNLLNMSSWGERKSPKLT